MLKKEKLEQVRKLVQEHTSKMSPEEADCYKQVVRERVHRMMGIRVAQRADMALDASVSLS